MAVKADVYEGTMERLRKMHGKMTDAEAIGYLVEEIEYYREKLKRLEMAIWRQTMEAREVLSDRN